MIIGLLSIKNEARRIERVVRSIQPVCGRILILDDYSSHSDARFRSPFDGIHEARAKNYRIEEG